MTNDFVAIEFAVVDETIRICGGLEDYAGLEHPEIRRACAAYRQAAIAALEDDARAGRLVAAGPGGRRLLHSAWAGAHWNYTCGAIGTMSQLTEDEKAAVADANDAGREAAGQVIDDADAMLSEYRVAYMVDTTGEFEIVETFTAADDAEANAYAEANHDGEWYVLNDKGRNINAGVDS
jgi:hypothetical protein